MDMHLKNNLKRGKKTITKERSWAWPPSWIKLVNMSSKLDDVGYKYIILCLQTHEQGVININTYCLQMLKNFRLTQRRTINSKLKYVLSLALAIHANCHLYL